LHLLDIYRLDKVFSDYTDIRKELEYFSNLSQNGKRDASLAKKEEIIVFSKADLLDKDMKEHIVSEFKKKHKKSKIFVISAATGE
jgi:GTPase involved in cell partitioning and DNA repair